MTYIEKRKHKNGKISYRARVRQAGSPDVSQSFAKRIEAVKWSQRMEAEIRPGRYFGREEDHQKTFAEFIHPPSLLRSSLSSSLNHGWVGL
jgi:hypothetical protein